MSYFGIVSELFLMRVIAALFFAVLLMGCSSVGEYRLLYYDHVGSLRSVSFDEEDVDTAAGEVYVGADQLETMNRYCDLNRGFFLLVRSDTVLEGCIDLYIKPNYDCEFALLRNRRRLLGVARIALFGIPWNSILGRTDSE